VKTGYFPGCSMAGTSREFSSSLKEVLSALDIELNEIEDWNCCGASSAHVTSHLLATALPARNLNLASQQGFDQVFAPCAACYSRLLSVGTEMKNNEKMRAKVEEVISEKMLPTPEVINLLQYFQGIGKEKITEQKEVDLAGLKVACYYGCLLVRPNNLIDFDDSEMPTSMEAIVSYTGAEPIEWNFKTECCGAAHSIPHTNIVEVLSKKIIDDAVAHGADVIVVGCPMCHSNLDMRQRNILKDYPDTKQTPILYLSELLGISFGIDMKTLGLNLHYIDPIKLIENKINGGGTK
jgi:heterodisulfide reductase subunit B2